MIKYTLIIDGMKCGMCESHINDIVRKTVTVKSVKSSHIKKLTTIICKEEFDAEVLKNAISELGYIVLSINKEPYEKKFFFK